MKSLTMFYLSDCGYCDKAFRALDEFYLEKPAYKEIHINRVEESLHPEIADQYDTIMQYRAFSLKRTSSLKHIFL